MLRGTELCEQYVKGFRESAGTLEKNYFCITAENISALSVKKYFKCPCFKDNVFSSMSVFISTFKMYSPEKSKVSK